MAKNKKLASWQPLVIALIANLIVGIGMLLIVLDSTGNL